MSKNMSNKPLSLTEFILKEQQAFPKAHGNFSLLMEQIEYACKIIASHVRQAGLVDILGVTGEKNTFQDEVKKIDVFSNDLLIEVLKTSGQVAMIASEELTEPIALKENAPYIVFFDPLDGSSNTDINAPIGTIFSIYHTKGGLLQKGSEQVAAGYVLYGTSTIFVYTSGKGVNGFTLDPAIGTFLLSHPDIKIPEFNNLYSVNEGESLTFNKTTQKFLHWIKQSDPTTKRPYKLRYIGAMIADVHRTLLKGGLFLYPATGKNPKGKLRLMYEANPAALILREAGGLAFSDKTPILDLMPEHVHQQVPVVLGSKGNLEVFQEF